MVLSSYSYQIKVHNYMVLDIPNTNNLQVIKHSLQSFQTNTTYLVTISMFSELMY